MFEAASKTQWFWRQRYWQVSFHIGPSLVITAVVCICRLHWSGPVQFRQQNTTHQAHSCIWIRGQSWRWKMANCMDQFNAVWIWATVQGHLSVSAWGSCRHPIRWLYSSSAESPGWKMVQFWTYYYLMVHVMICFGFHGIYTLCCREWY